MIHRVALFVASLAAVAVLAVGLAATGIVPSAQSPAADPVVATTQPPAEPTIQVDTVYLAPPVPPQDITVTRTVQSGGEHDDDHEGRGDD